MAASQAFRPVASRPVASRPVPFRSARREALALASLAGRRRACLAESSHVGRRGVVGNGSQHSIDEGKRRIVGSPKAWRSVAPIYPRADAKRWDPWPYVTIQAQGKTMIPATY